jgi:hypothetical protein
LCAGAKIKRGGKMTRVNGLTGEDSFHSINKKISKKIRENILSGRWPAESPEEVRMLKEHRAKLKEK